MSLISESEGLSHARKFICWRENLSTERTASLCWCRRLASQWVNRVYVEKKLKSTPTLSRPAPTYSWDGAEWNHVDDDDDPNIEEEGNGNFTESHALSFLFFVFALWTWINLFLFVVGSSVELDELRIWLEKLEAGSAAAELLARWWICLTRRSWKLKKFCSP